MDALKFAILLADDDEGHGFFINWLRESVNSINFLKPIRVNQVVYFET